MRKLNTSLQTDFSLNLPIFLKLGGSLITDKRKPESVRYKVIQQVAEQIALARQQNPSLQLMIGHGSGSFGHHHAKRYGTRLGVKTAEEWMGFAQTSDAASRLSRIVTQVLLEAKLPVWSLQPSVALSCTDGVITAGPEYTIQRAMARGLIPIVHGDVVLDCMRGGTIVSTEEIFEWLATFIRPKRLILVGEVDGIYTADPLIDPTAIQIPLITPESVRIIADKLGASHGVDVTGGMVAKVERSLAMVQQHVSLQEVLICSGLIKDQLFTTLLEPETDIGTRIRIA